MNCLNGFPLIRIPVMVWCSALLISGICFSGICRAQDMRQSHQAVELRRQELVQKARAEEAAARREAAEQFQRIAGDRALLTRAIDTFKSDIADLTKANKALQQKIVSAGEENGRLKKELDETAAVNREFRGMVQSNAKDLKALSLQSLQSGLTPDRHAFIEPVIQSQRFPTMDDMGQMTDLLFSEIEASGQVNLTRSTIVDRKGREKEAEILLLGNFTGIYRLGKEIGFLLYSDASQRYFALSRLPSARIRDNIEGYLAGERSDVYMDISKGGAIRQMVHELSLVEQVPKGGAIVWPILALFGIAVLILVERVLFFLRRQVNAEALMGRLRKLSLDGDWEGCRTLLESKRKKLIPKVLLSALALKDRSRPEVENALQEAILGEIPAIERFLSTLGILAGIAPLLGLLGTVTGMINTFHVITYYGTGDPRMMSGGISEALVTTMLGLAVAIPIMLAHTFLSRRVETQICRMEEKSVAFVNMMFRTRAGGKDSDL